MILDYCDEKQASSTCFHLSYAVDITHLVAHSLYNNWNINNPIKGVGSDTEDRGAFPPGQTLSMVLKCARSPTGHKIMYFFPHYL